MKVGFSHPEFVMDPYITVTYPGSSDVRINKLIRVFLKYRVFFIDGPKVFAYSSYNLSAMAV